MSNSTVSVRKVSGNDTYTGKGVKFGNIYPRCVLNNAGGSNYRNGSAYAPICGELKKKISNLE